MGTYFYFQELDPSHVENFRFIPILSLGIFIFFFSIGIGPISFVLQGELFSNQAKAFAAPIGQFFNFLLFFGIVLLFVALEQAIGNGGTFFMFAGFSAASIIFTAVFVKETKGKSLMEIQEMLSKWSKKKWSKKITYDNEVLLNETFYATLKNFFNSDFI